MITIAIPDWGTVHVQHVVLDVNGTLTLDGVLLTAVVKRIARLRELVDVELLTADTRGRLAAIEQVLGVPGSRLTERAGAGQKRAYVKRLGADRVAAIGNGMNDVGMLEVAELGIAVIGPEGAAAAVLRVADVVTTSAVDALDLLLEPVRLIATLRG